MKWRQEMKSFSQYVAEFANLSQEEKANLDLVLEKVKPYWENVEEATHCNQLKVLQAFRKNNVSEFHLNGSTGYGYGDSGREVLEAVWADIFHAEKAMVRSNIVSGTHAIATVLFGLLRPHDKMVAISGDPYDTLQKVIGKSPDAEATLLELQVEYESIALRDDDFDEIKIREKINSSTRLVLIQRSRGYEWRKSLSIEKIERVCQLIRTISPNTIIFVDNCYGEFVEDREPLEVGADIIAGSLIKNPGGGLAPRGGYIAGRAGLVQRCGMRLTAPGIADDVSSALDFNRPAFHGLFIAPLIVEQALKGAIFSACYLQQLGYDVSPTFDEERTDIIQAIAFGSADRLRQFSKGIQEASPLESYVSPIDSAMPGYDDPVIMAGGTFVQGSSIELSIDGPMRMPYIGYMQGGLSSAHVVAAVCLAVKGMEA